MSNQKEERLSQIRHSLAHLLAAAVRQLYPGAQNAIGPSIENGFYQDFGGVSQPVSENDLPKIEEKMREILKGWGRSEGREVTLEEARKEFAWNPYKLELIEEFAQGGKTLTFYTFADFVDLCKGGHAEDARDINPEAFKLTKVAGAYWRGDGKNEMLTRIYGVAFETKEELDAYLHMLAEAEKRDHKKLGRELDLFVFSELVGPGLPLWTPKGTLMRHLLDQFVWDLRRARGYERVEIPHITKKELYQTSGHWDKFKDELFRITTREGHEFAMKPMNCPHHTQIYARRPWSYRELPQRYANTTMVYRDEQTGELGGLSRVRAITQDDAHVFCRLGQAKAEALKIWDIIHEFYGAFGFDMRVRLSLRDPEHPESYLGQPEQWEKAQQVLREIAREKHAEAFEGMGEAAFYGPKLDFMAKDSIGREHQVATIQFDFNQPERFDLTCINEQGNKERIVMLHAAIMGSIERFLAVLIEHTAGIFPVWLAPVQAAVLPVSEKFDDYGKSVMEKLQGADVRVELKEAKETLGRRIREAELQKVPYILVVGEKEQQAQAVAVRHITRGQEDTVGIEEFIAKLKTEARPS